MGYNFIIMKQYSEFRNFQFGTVLLAIILLFTQCKKDTGNNDDMTTTTIPKNYLPTTAGSTFTYHSITNTDTSDYTLTATAADSLVNGKRYLKFTASDGITRYRLRVGGTYYQLSSFPSLPGSPVLAGRRRSDRPGRPQTGRSRTRPLGV